MKWISVKDKLPEKSGEYLCWCVDGFGNKCSWVGYWDEARKGFYPKWADNPSRNEQYWMQLPPPPNGKYEEASH